MTTRHLVPGGMELPGGLHGLPWPTKPDDAATKAYADTRPGPQGNPGPPGDTGPQGPPGPANLVIAQAQPVVTQPTLWLETDGTGAVIRVWQVTP